MGICNRDKDASEQKFCVNRRTGQIATGVTYEYWTAPFPCTIEQVQVAAAGLSGAPQWALQINRFVVGSGATAIPGVAAAQAIPAFSTSGLFEMTLATSGSSLLKLETGDVVEIVSSVSNTNVNDSSVSLVATATQDIKTYF